MSEIRKAAAVLLIREAGEAGIEAYLTQRPDSMRFVGGAYVFPGGVVEPGDSASGLEVLIDGRTPAEMAQILELSPAGGSPFWIAALRELFEETGILYARRRRGGPLLASDEKDDQLLSRCRAGLEEQADSLAGILQEEGLLLAADRLFYFDHKITPEGCPLRYDTHFFAARLPEGQTAIPSGREVVKDAWLSPAEALGRWEQGELPMMPPTVALLERLLPHHSWEAVQQECCSKNILFDLKTNLM